MNTKANTIREALNYEARTHLAGSTAGATLHQFAASATDDELLRFAELINNATQPAPVEDWENIVSVDDSASLARKNID